MALHHAAYKSGDKIKVIDLANRVLEPYGGKLYEGFSNQESFRQSLSEEHLVEGVKQLIIRLSDAKVRLAVASSAARPKIEFVLSRFELSRYFDCSVSGYEVKASKPAPEIKKA